MIYWLIIELCPVIVAHLINEIRPSQAYYNIYFWKTSNLLVLKIYWPPCGKHHQNWERSYVNKKDFHCIMNSYFPHLAVVV